MFELDFIIVAKNELDYSQRFVESLVKDLHRPAHLIFIDNASTDETPAYFKSLKDKESDRLKITIHTNKENQGYAIALNQGIEYTSAPYVFFCNNDLEVYPGAIEELVAIAKKRPEIGLVNPATNDFGFMSYDENQVRAGKGKWLERCQTSGFMALVKREVIQKIGGIDLAFSPAYFEDMDYAERAKQAGYLCVMAYGAYVYHFGGKTFGSKRREELWQKNREVFNARWGATHFSGYLGDKVALVDPARRKKVIDSLLKVVRKGSSYCYLYIPKGTKQYFEGVHVGFRLVEAAPFLAPTLFFAKALRSLRKKPIQELYVSSQGNYQFCEKFRFLHQAKVKNI